MKTIPLTRGKFAIVDDDDYDRVSEYKWQASVKVKYREYCYARRHFNKNGKEYFVKMHRFILNAPRGVEVDHVNGNGIDNRKENLRLCSTSQNQQNSRKKHGTVSRYKGVYYDKERRKWRASINLHKKRTEIGRYDREEDAAAAYDVYAIQLYGDFAHLNFQQDGSPRLEVTA